MSHYICTLLSKKKFFWNYSGEDLYLEISIKKQLTKINNNLSQKKIFVFFITVFNCESGE